MDKSYTSNTLPSVSFVITFLSLSCFSFPTFLPPNLPPSDRPSLLSLNLFINIGSLNELTGAILTITPSDTHRDFYGGSVGYTFMGENLLEYHWVSSYTENLTFH